VGKCWRTGLEKEGTTDVDVSAIAGGLDTLLGTDKRTQDEGSGAAYAVERAELDGHDEEGDLCIANSDVNPRVEGPSWHVVSY
jgi:hypothetical protein